MDLSLTANAFARMLKALLPPGKAWRLRSSGVLGGAMLGAADELVRVQDRGKELLVESDPRTADELLPDFEAMLDLPSTGTLAERRARVVAHLVTLQRRRPADYQRMLAPLFGMVESTIPIIERGRAFAVLVSDDDEIYRFFAYRDPDIVGSYDITSAQALIDRAEDAHTEGYAIESTMFRCDDAYSLCDRDLIGDGPASISSTLEFWVRGDSNVTVISGGVFAWFDLSGHARDLSQATDARRPVPADHVIAGLRSVVRFGPTADDKFMSWGTPWAAPSVGTAYFVVRMRTTTAYQVLAFLSGTGPTLYLGGDGTDFARNRPALYSTSDRAVWSADLADQTTYLVKFAWDQSDAVNSFYWTQVNNGTEVASGAIADSANPGNFNSLGLDPGVSGSQDLISDVAEVAIYSKRLTGGEEAAFRAYASARYGIVMS